MKWDIPFFFSNNNGKIVRFYMFTIWYVNLERNHYEIYFVFHFNLLWNIFILFFCVLLYLPNLQSVMTMKYFFFCVFQLLSYVQCNGSIESINIMPLSIYFIMMWFLRKLNASFVFFVILFSLILFCISIICMFLLFVYMYGEIFMGYVLTCFEIECTYC